MTTYDKINQNRQEQKLPLEYGLKTALKIYGKRLTILLLVTVIYALLGIILYVILTGNYAREAILVLFIILLAQSLLFLLPRIPRAKDTRVTLHIEFPDYRDLSKDIPIYLSTNLYSAKFIEADLRGSINRLPSLRGIESNKSLAGYHLENANLIDEYLVGRHLAGARLMGANLTRANLTRANLMGTDLTAAILIEAYLTQAHLEGARLTGANLNNAMLRGARLTGANLTGADLTGADLTGADLTGADLTGAILEGTKLGNVGLDDNTVAPNGSQWTPNWKP